MCPTTCPGLFFWLIYSSIHPCMYPPNHSICIKRLLCVRYLYKVLWVQKLTYYMAEDDLWRKLKQVKGQTIMKKEVLLHRGWCRTVSLIRWHLHQEVKWVTVVLKPGKTFQAEGSTSRLWGRSLLGLFCLEGSGIYNGQDGLSWLNGIT